MTDPTHLTSGEFFPLHTHPELLLNMEEPLISCVLNLENPPVNEKLAREDAGLNTIHQWPFG